ncbi:MAG TPA: ATP-binding protein, partial [Prolixibacteraceae bacterium]
ADKEQLSRAFLNLVKNGIQAIPADQKGEISISVQKLKSVALISISDNGTGISQDAQDHLFEPNFTTKTSGMGLGLSIVRNIITNFRGKIWHETSETQGTIFYVEIPLYESSLPAENNYSQ